MSELIYPDEPARLYPGCKQGKAYEMLPVCDESGRVLSQASREFCHDHNLLHPVVHLNIITRLGSLVLQKRGSSKKFWPLKWDFVAAGHIVYGEEVMEALRRETFEEVALTDFNPVLMASYLYDDGNERELVNSFAAVGSYELHPNPDEVAQTGLWSPDDIRNSFGTGVLTPTFEYEYTMIADKLFALL